MTTFEISQLIDAPRPQVWDALADIGSIHVWNPGVKDSRTTSADSTGLGATRHCDLGGRNYLDEEVVEFTDLETITMRIVDSNMPFDHADIRFTLEADGDATKVTVSPEYRLRFGPLGKLMDVIAVRRTYEKGMHALLSGLKRHVETAKSTS